MQNIYRDKKKTVYEINFTIYLKDYDDTSDDGLKLFTLRTY